MGAPAYAEVIAEHVGAAVLAIAHVEERIAHEALERTPPERWGTLEWISEHPTLDTCAGVWPRAIACRLDP